MSNTPSSPIEDYHQHSRIRRFPELPFHLKLLQPSERRLSVTNHI